MYMTFIMIALFLSFFFFNDTATTEIYTLSLHDALPISVDGGDGRLKIDAYGGRGGSDVTIRSEEHTSELQSRFDLVCRLLLEKKKKIDWHICPITTRITETVVRFDIKNTYDVNEGQALVVLDPRDSQVAVENSSFFFNDTATTEIYTLSLHDALPISLVESGYPPAYVTYCRERPVSHMIL